MNIKKHRQAVAKKRGESWKKSLKAGRKAVKESPSALRKLRDKKELNSVELAKKVGVTRSSFQEIETGRRMVRTDVAEKIAKTLKIPISTIFKKEKYGRLRVKGGHNVPEARK